MNFGTVHLFISSACIVYNWSDFCTLARWKKPEVARWRCFPWWLSDMVLRREIDGWPKKIMDDGLWQAWGTVHIFCLFQKDGYQSTTWRQSLGIHQEATRRHWGTLPERALVSSRCDIFHHRTANFPGMAKNPWSSGAVSISQNAFQPMNLSTGNAKPLCQGFDFSSKDFFVHDIVPYFVQSVFSEAMMLLSKLSIILHGLKGLPCRITWANKPWIFRSWRCWRQRGEATSALHATSDPESSPEENRRSVGSVAEFTPWVGRGVVVFFFASISGGFAVFGGVGRGTGFVTGDVIEYVPKALFCFGSNGILWVYA